MSDCEHLEQQLAQMEATVNLLDALRADIPPDELYGLALTGLCDLRAYPAGSLWAYRDQRYRCVATIGMVRERAQLIGAATMDKQMFSRLLAAAEQRVGAFCLTWPIAADVSPALQTALADGHTLIGPLVGTAPVGIAALEARTTCPEAGALEHLGRLADQIAAKLEAAHFMQENARAIAELQRLYNEQRRMQETILELSAPLLPLLPGVLVLPLVGAIDTLRAGRMLEAELEAITVHRATVVLVDITGVPIVDTSVALQLIRAADAAKLLGCQTVLVGVRPEIAQTLVGLGLDLRGIATRATLADGLETALRLSRRQIIEMR
jgi:anti-anti-sigma regulatory factor